MARPATGQVGLLIVVVAVVSLLATTAAPAAANFGSSGTPGVIGTTNGVWLTNNNFFNVAKRNLNSTYNFGVNNTVNNDYDLVTDFTANSFQASSCDDGAYDVCVYDSNYGDNGLNG